MKKYLFVASALVLGLSFTACQSDDALLEEGTGSIALTIANTDAKVLNRGTVAANATDWMVKVNNDDAITVAALATKTYAAAESNTLSVYNFADISAALAANNGRGAGYWKGEATPFAINAGETTQVSVDCGVAENAAFSVVYNDSFTALAADGYTLTASQGQRSLGYTSANEGTAYFEAGSLSYTLTGSIKGNAINITKNVTLTAGTNTQLTVKANTAGTVTLSITYTDFTTDTSNELVIDAVTGSEVAQN